MDKYLCKAKREKAISAIDAMPDPGAMSASLLLLALKPGR
ncbi:hypothetical protein BDI4_540022 [Burkholderia diffusa]|nr:hypothetical protein BDI4_540022 [Burkholderia diffusa]